MAETYDDDRNRIADLVEIFQAKGQARDQRAGDPAGFVRLAYIAKSAVDRTLGPGNAHSAGLVELCDALEPGDGAGSRPALDSVTECYRRAAHILRAAAQARLQGGLPR